MYTDEVIKVDLVYYWHPKSSSFIKSLVQVKSWHIGIFSIVSSSEITYRTLQGQFGSDSFSFIEV